MGYKGDYSQSLAPYQAHQLHGRALEQALMGWIESGKSDIVQRNHILLGCRWIAAGVAIERARAIHAPELFDDLLGAAEEGVLFAIGKADPAQLKTFKTYAWQCAKGYVQDAITREHSSLIVGQEKYDRRHKVKKVMRSSDVSLNQAVGPDREDTLLDLLEDVSPSVLNQVAACEMKERVSSALMKLDPFERFVVTQRIFEDVPGPDIARQWAEQTGRLYTNANIHATFKRGLERLFNFLGRNASAFLSEVPASSERVATQLQLDPA